MLTRYLHYLDQNGLTSFLRAGGHIQQLAQHSHTPEGLAHFSAWLSQAKAGTHTVLADLPDEAFLAESLPKVSGADRQALIARKQQQLFFASPYATAISLGHEKTGRRDERVLFTALTRPPALEPWLHALQQAEAPLAALLSVPLLTRQLLTRLAPKETHGLILSVSSSGIRQTYFEHGELRFSRLSAAPEGDFATWGDACLRETQKTLQYINTQRWITRSTRLPVYLLLARHDFAPVLAQLEHADTLDFQLINLETLAHGFGERARATSSDSQPLMLRLALRQGHRPQLAPPPARHGFHLLQARRAILASGGALAALILGLALYTYQGSRQLTQTQALVDTQSLSEDLRYQQLLSSLPPLPTNLESLRSVVDDIALQRQQSPDPLSLWLPLSHTLSQFPDIELLTLSWQLDGPAHTNISSRLLATLPLAAANDPRAAITRIRDFAAALREQGLRVSTQALPFEVESDKTLHSSTDTQNKRPEFSLLLQPSLPAAQP